MQRHRDEPVAQCRFGEQQGPGVQILGRVRHAADGVGQQLVLIHRVEQPLDLVESVADALEEFRHVERLGRAEAQPQPEQPLEPLRVVAREPLQQVLGAVAARRLR